MTDLLHELVSASADACSGGTAIVDGARRVSYGEVDASMRSFAAGLIGRGFNRQDRLAVYLPKQVEMVVSVFGTSVAGGIFVPVNPVLKAQQVSHVLRDCGARILVTDPDRLSSLQPVLDDCEDLDLIVLTGSGVTRYDGSKQVESWDSMTAAASPADRKIIDADVAAILYTSGSTGKPKGVVLSHRNLVCGAKTVSSYLDNDRSDRILAALPLSFDAGFSQVLTAFYVGATAVLHNFYFPADLVKVAGKERITGLTAVPPLWAQIADQKWPDETRRNLRYFANTGGKMPRSLLQRLRELFPEAQPFLMYGLTEAFRSTYLPPSEIDRRPDSIGKAIPNAEILVLRKDGTPCEPGEPGELVHRGALVAQGYWNAPELTAKRFRPLPTKNPNLPIDEIAVWSGDTVRADEDGFLYFVGREDDMIKTSGYRVSPTEVEEAGFESRLVKEVAALGLPDERLGQRIVIVAVPASPALNDEGKLLQHYQASLPAFMVPSEIHWRDQLPRSGNGKIDRQRLLQELTRKTAEQVQ